MNETKRIVIGVGNPDRGDDAAGRALVTLLRDKLPADTQLQAHNGEMTDLLDLFDGKEAVYLVDAAASSADPGAIHRFDASAAPLPNSVLSMSTHGFGVAEAIEMARALGSLPATCVVYAVEAASFETGRPLSAPVAAAIEQISEYILRELGNSGNANEDGHA